LVVGTVGLAVLGGAPATAAPGDPPPIGTVGLSPTHGPPTGPILATYHLAPMPARCPARADFAFDNVPVGSAPFLPGNAACIATLKLLPPPNTPAGNHYVSVRASDGVHAASSLYVVDLGASPSASPSPSPKPSHSPSPSPSRSRATPSATTSFEYPLPVPVESDSTSPDAGAAADAGQGVTTTGGPWLVVALVFGGLLVLGGLLMLGLLVYYHHRARRPAGPPDDSPTVAFPRPPMPEG
jgi:hypothetical protein